MIKLTKLKYHIHALLEEPVTQNFLALKAALDEFPGINNGIRKLNPRKNVGCYEMNYLSGLIDEVYEELRYTRSFILARTMVLLLAFARKIAGQLSPRCDEALLPKVMFDRAKRKVDPIINAIQRPLLAAGIEEDLISLVIKPLRLLSGEKKISLRMFLYIELHTKALKKLNLQYLNQEEATEELFRLMVELNFNYLGFTDYYVSWFKRKLIAHYIDKQDKIRHLSIQERRIKNLTLRSRYSYNLNLKAAQDHLVQWFSYERRRLRKC